ncbi:MAG TPA: hypothetical protein VFV95_02000 [Vicinamibacterales bacterium]|nr:hypothetical protein [Vicinamibacterales bacterium]
MPFVRITSPRMTPDEEMVLRLRYGTCLPPRTTASRMSAWSRPMPSSAPRATEPLAMPGPVPLEQLIPSRYLAPAAAPARAWAPPELPIEELPLEEMPVPPWQRVLLGG